MLVKFDFSSKKGVLVVKFAFATAILKIETLRMRRRFARVFAPVIGTAYTMTTKREAQWSVQTKAQNTEKGMYVGLKQPRGDGKRYVTPARAAAKETSN